MPNDSKEPPKNPPTFLGNLLRAIGPKPEEEPKPDPNQEPPKFEDKFLDAKTGKPYGLLDTLINLFGPQKKEESKK